MLIRPGGPADLAFVRALAVEAFAAFGDYRQVIPEWLSNQGVLTFVAEQDGRPIGFAMVGFYRLGEECAADLLAIAVAQGEERRGVGRRLLEQALRATRAARGSGRVTEIQLSVAEPNLRARRLFAAAGFVEVPGDHGTYDGGQRAIHMKMDL
jgi:ribosomal protein S18 acetylase RimI-like enzyme